MEELFATKIVINKLLNIEGFEIPLSETERKHLIITGKNGSGKTTLLNDLKRFFGLLTEVNDSHLASVLNSLQFYYNEINKVNSDPNFFFPNPEERQKDFDAKMKGIDYCEANLRNNPQLLSYVILRNPFDIRDEFEFGNFIFAFFEAKRNKVLKTPSGINKIAPKKFYEIEDNAGFDFIQHIVNLRADQAFANEDKDVEGARKIDEWFEDFERNLFELFDHSDAKLQFDRKNYNFNIVEKDKPPYNLNQLSDGYSAIFSIITELIMRMETHKVNSYDVQGVVLIDEIETHLHIALQKKILPFLISFFPRIQFIVTTHSPFVISSVSNAVICDLEKKIVTEDLSGYSYEAIVESYFDVDQYSEELKNEVKEYDQLMGRKDLDDTEKERMLHLDKYLHDLPKFASNGLAAKIQQIKLKHLKEKAA